ncbi:MAG: NAD(P)H-dependent oxidoreductase [Tannerellaceae bacterium]|nr:NAD(P)H-dependent oxidoreductase [Tannerellaceae bacterium]
MNILIIYSHPGRKSYTFRVLKQLVNALQKENHHVEISDLYDMNFQTDMTEQEYEREGFAKIDLPVSDDIAKEHEKIEQSDCIIFLYPVWWSDCPAKLKGWFDRVYSVGYAYGYDANGQKIQKMKKIKSGIVICTAGHSNEFLEETEIAESMRKVMLNDRLGERFDKKEMIILGGTLYIEEVEEFHTDCLRKLVKQIR